MQSRTYPRTVEGYYYATQPHEIVSVTVIRHFDAPRRESASRMTRAQSLNAKARDVIRTNKGKGQIAAFGLTKQERDEIRQTCALVLLQFGALDKLPRGKRDRFKIWRTAFITTREVVQRLRAPVQARGLRQEFQAVNWSEDFTRDATELLPLPALPHPDAQAIFEARVRRKTRAALRVMRAALRADPSRQRKAKRNGARDTLRYCLAGVLPTANLRAPIFPSDEARWKAIQRLKEYLTSGIIALNNAAPNLPRGSFHNFAELCEAMDAPRRCQASLRMKLKAA